MNPINTIQIFNAQTIAASGNAESEALDLLSYSQEKRFSLQVALSGDGTGKFTYELSNDGETYLTPTGASDIKTSFTKTGGPGSDGKDLFAFTPELGRFLKIKAAETGTTDTITVTATLAIQ